MSDRSDRIKELAESFTEKALAFVIGLPKPFTFIVVFAWSAVFFAAGKWL